MNIYDAILRDFPYAAYKFNTNAASYPNIMGITDALTTTASRYEVPLVVGDSLPLILGGTVTAKIPCPRFNAASTGLPFTLEAWVNFQTAGAMSIMSHTGQTDGLYFDGDDITFGTFNTQARWAVPDLKKTYYVVGVYDGAKLSLYIDGVISDEVDIDEPLPAFADSYLYAGASAAGQTLLFEAPAVYKKALSPADIYRHYRYGRDIVSAPTLVGQLGGSMFDLTDNSRDVAMTYKVDWRTAGKAEMVDAGDALSPTFDETDTSVAGSYTFSLPMFDNDPEAPATYAGIKAEWNGDGAFTVQSSVDDGATWQALTNNSLLTNSFGLVRASTPLIKILMPVGVAPGDVEVRDMTLTAYNSTAIRPVTSGERTVVTERGITSGHWSEPIEMDDGSGAKLTNLGISQITESTDPTPTNISTIEFWVKFDTATGVYLLDSRSMTPSNASYIWISGTGVLGFAGFSAVYVNGIATVSSAKAMVKDRWYHIVGVYSAAHNARINISPNVAAVNKIGLIATYPTALTAAQVATLYNSYFGLVVGRVNDPNTVVVTEDVSGIRVYARDWSITSAGG